MSNKTRGVFAPGSSSSNAMEYITIASTGNAVDFGDMVASYYQINDGTGSNHGGIA